MNRDVLREAAHIVMRSAKQRILKKSGLEMSVVYVLPNGGSIKEQVDNCVPNSSEAKSIQFAMIQRRTKELNAQAVIHVSDAWFLDCSKPIYQQRMEEFGIQQWIAKQDRLGVVEAAKAGMGDAWEVVQVLLQTPEWTYNLIQKYERRGAEGNHIIFIGQPFAFDPTEDPRLGWQGRGASAYADNPIDPAEVETQWNGTKPESTSNH